MQLQALVPMLWTENLTKTVEFYTIQLGFTCGEINEDWGWAAMHRDSVEIMVAVPNAHTPFTKATFTGSLYIRTDMVDELWEQLKDKVQVVYGLDNFEYGMREFAIYDNNGYMLQFGEEIEQY